MTAPTPHMDTERAPLVSVVIPCFNAGGFIAEAIQSALDQTLTDLEVIVVDDGSTDGSREIVTAMAERDARVVPLLLPHNLGPAAARNSGFAMARGTWVALLDADDLYRPGRLAALIELAEANRADVVADNQVVHDLDHAGAERPAFSHIEPGDIVHVDRRFFFAHIWETGGSYPMGLLKPLFRRAFITKHGIAYDPRYRLGEDFQFYLECIVAGARFYLTGDAHYVYRHHSDSLSHAASGAYLALARMCDEIAERHRDRLDAKSLSRLRDRRDACRNLGRSIQVRELQALRRSGDLRAIATYLRRDPGAAINLLAANAAWRMRQLARLIAPRAAQPAEARNDDP